MKLEPATLIIDVEISFDIIASYGLREQYHRPENIIQDWFMICACWKWLGAKKINSVSLIDDMRAFKKDPACDRRLIETLHDVISEADVIVGHNVDKFDWKKLYSRILHYGLPPLRKPLVVDTLKEVRRIAAFSSNKMSYLAKYLGIPEKAHHADDMWLRVLRCDASAVEEAVKYCKQDIVTTEALYLRLRPHMLSHPNHNLFRADGVECCRKCGHEELIKKGFAFTNTGKYQRFKCKACGAWSTGTKRIRGVMIK